MSSKKRVFTIYGIFAILIIGIFIFLFNHTTKIVLLDVEGYTPIKNDPLAREFAPSIIAQAEEDEPIGLYYRAAKDEFGNTYIAYHFLWEKEVNNNKGIKPFLNRILYTGGLKLQSKIFGKGDIEVIEVKLNANDEIVQVTYEIPEDYDENDFSVKHETIVKNDNISYPLKFKVASWNHLFEYVDGKNEISSDYKEYKLVPNYFADELWNEYEMVKEKEKISKKSRAHFEYERISY